MLMMCLPPMPPRSHLVDDFANRAAGSLVGQGWSNLDAGTDNATWTVSSDSASLSGKKLTIDKTTSDARRRLSFDIAGTPADVEVLVRFKLAQIPADDFDNTAQINVRANSTTGYYCDLFLNASAVGRHGLQRITGLTTAAVIDTGDFDFNTTDFTWCRFRVVGTSLKSKCWFYGDPEPAFENDASDANLASGAVALGTFYTDANWDVDFFSVALGGATAPFPAG
jgi:hypothetical protein